MIDGFISTYKRLLQNTNYKHHRYIYKEFNTDNRLTGLIGPRGTGKTTLLLQYINEKIENKDDCIYVSIDHIYFSKNNLLEFINELYDDYGVRYFFFDEIHKYPNWNQELKNAYDSYPDIKIVFSGSSSIDLIKGTYDLSRRGVLYRIGGLSFREYLLFNNILDAKVVTLGQILDERGKIEEEISNVKRIKGYFKDYLGTGYYPFYLEDKNTYNQKILRIIEKTIFEDISNFYNLKTENLSNFKRILSYLATIPPGELNINSISKNIGLDNKTIQNYLNILKETGMIELLGENRAGSNLLKQTEKIYLDNQDLYNAIIEEIGYESKIGTIREIFFIKMIKNSGHKIYYNKTGDFEVEGTIYEIGGKNKKLKQIKEKLGNAYLVKDDILVGSRYEIPLYLFGFLY
ncbi:ATP-binding protein [Sediminispirochaeta bajacaliforniensis]|uniref:ATP-binding protein n=1 Tax=Sediminispirochaeta bajacaliforniensis TaxID=148 RepID=UPI00037AF0DB|nr:AAA family ATPase [Sediminispirochaeta bajacaliforniensis]